MARIMEFLISSYEPFVFACLFGVIVGSIPNVGVGIPRGFLCTFGVAGTVLGVGLSIAGTMEITDPGYLHFLLGGALAVAAWGPGGLVPRRAREGVCGGRPAVAPPGGASLRRNPHHWHQHHALVHPVHR